MRRVNINLYLTGGNGTPVSTMRMLLNWAKCMDPEGFTIFHEVQNWLCENSVPCHHTVILDRDVTYWQLVIHDDNRAVEFKLRFPEENFV